MTDNAGLKGAAKIAAEQVASTKNVRIKPDIVDPLKVCQAERDQARRSAKFWNENSADLSAQIAERTDALIAAKARAEKAEDEVILLTHEIERLRKLHKELSYHMNNSMEQHLKDRDMWRNTALEEAAQVAEAPIMGYVVMPQPLIAAAIRTLKEKTDE